MARDVTPLMLSAVSMHLSSFSNVFKCCQVFITIAKYTYLLINIFTAGTACKNVAQNTCRYYAGTWPKAKDLTHEITKDFLDWTKISTKDNQPFNSSLYDFALHFKDTWGQNAIGNLSFIYRFDQKTKKQNCLEASLPKNEKERIKVKFTREKNAWGLPKKTTNHLMVARSWAYRQERAWLARFVVQGNV